MSDQKLSPRVPELDGIRGTAIFLVVIWHYIACSIPTDPPSKYLFVLSILRFTWSGVDLFFVLSGFLIGGILMDNKSARNYFPVFYLRRICRIFPLYFLWIALFAAIVYFFPDFISWGPVVDLFAKPSPMWVYATYMQNMAMAQADGFGADWLSITWSLAVEEQFYLFIPLVISCFKFGRLFWLFIICIVAVPFLRMAVYEGVSPITAYLWTPCRLDTLLMGVLCAWLVRRESIKQFLVHNTIWIYCLMILICGTVLVPVALRGGAMPWAYATVKYGYSALAIFYSCFLLIAVTEKRGLVSAIARNSFLQRLGVLAYGIYMVHNAVNSLCHALLTHTDRYLETWVDLLVTCFAAVVTYCLAALSWKYYEQPIVQWGHRWKYRNVEA